MIAKATKNAKANGKAPRKLRGATYTRMSSTGQSESPKQQLAEFGKLAATHNAEIVQAYKDDAVSGDNRKGRHGFKRLCEDAVAGKFDVIFAWDLDRFSREDIFDFAESIAPLRRAGVRLITVNQGEVDWQSLGGTLTTLINQHGNHEFLRKLSKNSIRGKRDRAETDAKWFGRVPYGYARGILDEHGKQIRIEPRGSGFRTPKGWNQVLVPSETDTEVLVWCFEQYANTDCGLRTLAFELNDRGVPPPTATDNWRPDTDEEGNPIRTKARSGYIWKTSTMRAMLSNDVYIGTYRFGAKKDGKYHCFDGLIVKENAHPALISRELFERVQKKLAERRRTHRRDRGGWPLLTGILRCGHCGGPMYGGTHTNKARGKAFRYYVCRDGLEGKCEPYRINATYIETAATDFLVRYVDDPAMIDALKGRIEEHVRKRSGKRVDTGRIKRQIASLDDQIKRGTENLLKATTPEIHAAADALLREWHDKRSALASQLAEQSPVKPQGSADELARKALAKLRDLVNQCRHTDPAIARAGFQGILEGIELTWKKRQPGERNREIETAKAFLRSDAVIGKDTPSRRLVFNLNISTTYLRQPGMIQLVEAIRELTAKNGGPVKLAVVSAALGLCEHTARTRIWTAVRRGLIRQIKIKGKRLRFELADTSQAPVARKPKLRGGADGTRRRREHSENC